MAASIDISCIVTKEKLASIFQAFDADGSGSITKENIKTAFSKFGVEITDEQADEIFSGADIDGDNQIDIDEFKCIFGMK